MSVEGDGASGPGTTSVTVYRYGGRRSADGRLADLPPHAMVQLRLAHDLREALVRVEEDYDAEIAAAWAAHPVVDPLIKAEAEAQAAVDAVLERARAQRSVDRSKELRAETAATLKVAKQALKEAKASRREAQETHYAEVNPTMSAAGRRRTAALTATRKAYVEQGLYWATATDVLDHHKTATKAVAAARKKGQPAQLRHHRWDATGTLTVQPQRAHGPDCRDATCVTRMLRGWRAEPAGSRLVLLHGDPDNPTHQEPLSGPGEAVAVLATILGVDPAALGAVQRDGKTWRFEITAEDVLLAGPGPKDPPRTPALLASGQGLWANQLGVSPYVDPDDWGQMSTGDRRRAGRGEALLQVQAVARGGRVGPDQQIRIPVQVHRMLPPDADVVLARLTRRRTGSQRSLALSVTADVPAVPARTSGPAAAVHIGWRVRDDKSLRVATWVSTEHLHLPQHLHDIAVDHGGWGEVIVPASWRSSFTRLTEIRGIRDEHIDRIKGRVAAWIDEHGPADVPGFDEPLTAAEVRRWRSPRRLVKLAYAWYDTGEPAPGDDVDAAEAGDGTTTVDARRRRQPTAACIAAGAGGLAVELEAWRRQDRHLWDWHAGGTRRLTERRDDAWRRFAAWLGRAARLIVLDDVDIRTLSRIPGIGDTDADDAQAQAARANRVVAAPGGLRQAIAVGAPRHGAGVAVRDSAKGTAVHYWCAQPITPAAEFAEQIRVWCDTCRTPVDQDRNMARMLLAAAGEVPAPGTLRAAAATSTGEPPDRPAEP